MAKRLKTKDAEKRRALFARKIKDSLRRMGWTQQQLADAIRVPRGTLTVHMKRGTFYPDELEQLSELLGLGPVKPLVGAHSLVLMSGTLKQFMEHQGTDLHGSVNALDRIANQIGKSARRTLPPYLDCIRRLGRNSVKVVATLTTTPLEMELSGSENREAIARAVSNGAIFIYIRPDQDAIDELEEIWFPGKVVTLRESMQEHRFLLEEVVKHLQEFGQAEADAKRIAETHILQLHIRSFPFWVPGISFSLFQLYKEKEFGQSVRRVSVRLPSQFALVCWHHETTESRLAKAIRKVLGQELDKPNMSQKETISNALNHLRDYWGGQS